MDHPKKFCSYKGAVLANECDSNNHMNVMYYINKFEHAGRSFSQKLGLGKPLLKEYNWGVAVVEQLIKYKREVFEDDILNIYSYAIGSTDKVMNFCHEMYNLETKVLSATINIKLVMFDLNKRKAINIPEQIIESINKYTLD
jgi:acyl-CoA thioester hydrolase